MHSNFAASPDKKNSAELTPPARFEPLAIVGMSCLFPGAETLGEYWASIKAGDDAITDVPESHWNASDYYDADRRRPDHTYASKGGFLPTVGFDPLKYGISPAMMEATDTSQLLGLLVAEGALEDAGYGPGREFDRQRVSVILGVTGALELTVSMGARLGHPVWRRELQKAGVAPAVVDEVVRNIGDSYVTWQEDTFPGLLGNVVAGRIASRLDLGGTNCVVDAACASSLSAAHLAFMELQTGRADMAITGGADTFNDIFMYMCFSKTQALSLTGDARPFAKNADGTILGEGIGMVVLKRLADAERDGDQIYAVIKGLGSSSDGRGKAIYTPSAPGQERALRAAYESAGVDPATVELVEAHGTGTKVGDATEVEALQKIFGEPENGRPWVALGSVKSQIGHTKAAAGVAGLMKIAMALKHKVLPPTIKVDEPNPAVDEAGAFYLNTEKRPWLGRRKHPRRAALSSFGFGGTNFHLIAEEHEPHKTEIDWDGRVQIVAFSAEKLDELKARVEEFATTDQSWKQLCLKAHETRQSFSSNHAFRLIQVLEKGKQDVGATFGELRRLLDENDGKRHWTTPTGASFGSGRRFGKIGFLFPGQGSQYVGMCLDLACLFPRMQEILLQADLAYGDMRGLALQLSDFIYPPPVFNLDQRKINELALRATDVAQPAICAVSLGAICILAMFGVSPGAAAGHSLGELMGLFTAGRIDVPTLLHLSRLRGELMAAQGEGDSGSMMAVRASAEEVEALLEEDDGLVLANFNSPKQVVVSGPTAAIDSAYERLRIAGLGAKKLPVAAAFHSPLVAGASEPFRATLEQVAFEPGTISVYANSTAAPYPDDATAARDLLGRQLAEPVRFTQQIESMYNDGVRTFVEVGPGSTLTALTRSILEGREFTAVALDASGGRGSGTVDLARALGQIAALGHSVDLAAWEATNPELARAASEDSRGMKIPINGANYRKPRPEKLVSAPALTSNHSHPRSEQLSMNGDSAHGHSGAWSPPDAGGGHAPADRASDAPSEPGPQAAVPPPQGGVAPVPAPGSAPVPPPPQGVAAFSNPASVPPLQYTLPPDANPALVEALRSAQQSFQALQAIQAQTAELHRRFLASQESAQRTYAQLIAQQSQWLASGAPGAGAPLPQHVSLPPELSAQFSAPLAQQMQAPAVNAAEQARAAQAAQTQSVTSPAGGLTGAPSAGPGSGAGLRDSIAAALLEVVSDKTGYPTEMLDPAMDMESELGIDSIKRVEILSAMQERLPELPQPEPDELASLRTLAEVIELLGATAPSAEMSAGNATGAIEAAPVPLSEPAMVGGGAGDVAAGAGHAEIEKLLLEIVGEKTGYPPEMLDPSMDMESDLGIDSIKRVEILSAVQERLPELAQPDPDELAPLRTLAEVAALLCADVPAGPESAGVPGAAYSNGIAPMPAPAVEVVPAVQPGLAGSDATANGGVTPERLCELLLAIVADKTGYPAEMLEVDMDLESDLGIDSIKRVEILSMLQEELPEAPLPEPDDVGRFRSLREVIDFLSAPGEAVAGSGQANAASVGSAAAAPTPPKFAPSAAPPAFAPASGGAVSFGRRNGKASPNVKAAPESEAAIAQAEPAIEQVALLHRTTLQAIALDTALDVSEPDIPADAPIFITREGGSLADALAERLREKNLTVRLIDSSDAASLEAAKKVGGLILLMPVTTAGPDEMWSRTSEARMRAAFRLARAAARAFASTKTPALFATVSRLDGAFGVLHPDLTFDPAQGALAGLPKTAAQEWPGVDCVAIDVAADFSDDEAAADGLFDVLFSETPMEIGIAPEGFMTLKEVEAPLTDEALVVEAPLAKGEVVIVSGGARGVTAETALALAEAYQPTLVLVGRTAEPGPEPEWLRGLKDERDIKRALIEHHSGGGVNGRTVPPSPREIDGIFRTYLAEREIRTNLERLRATGATVYYRAADVRDAKALEAALSEIRAQHGPVRGVVHGAGVLADKAIAEKNLDQFDRVFETKVGGLRALLEATRDDELRLLVLFSSVSARYGRVGQADYAMANELMNKVARREAIRRGAGCRVVAINWGPWEGGMVTPSLRRLFEKEGIELIPLRAGAIHLVRELQSAQSEPEVVVGGRWQRAGQACTGLVSMPVVRMREAEAITPVNEARGESVEDMHTPEPIEPTLEEIAQATLAKEKDAGAAAAEGATNGNGQSNGHGNGNGQGYANGAAGTGAPAEENAEPRPVFDRALNLEQFPFLASHVIAGRPVLPVAMMVEWFAHGALHENPGLLFHGIEDLKVLKGVAVDPDESYPVQVRAGRSERADRIWQVPVELWGGEDFKTRHATARVLLCVSLPESPEPAAGEFIAEAYPRSIADAYDELLFHGEFFRGIEAIDACDANGLNARVRTAPAPGEAMNEPARNYWLADPLVLDCALQSLILWNFERNGEASLPARVGAYRQFAARLGGEELRVMLRPQAGSSRIVRADMDILDGEGRVVARLESVENVMDPSLIDAFQQRTPAGSIA